MTPGKSPWSIRMSLPDLQIGFSWRTYGRTYHISFVITVQKSRSGGKAELTAKRAFSELLGAFHNAELHYYTQRLFFRDRPDFFVVEWSGKVDDRLLAERILAARSEEPWEIGRSGKAGGSMGISSS